MRATQWLAAMVLLAPAAFAQMPSTPAETDRLIPGERDGYVADAERGCWLWVGGLSDLAHTVEVRWSGACPDGPAHGSGRALVAWREGRAVRAMVYEGEVQGGRVEGLGTLAHLRNGEVTVIEAGRFINDALIQGRVDVLADALVYEGALQNGLPHGAGRLRGLQTSFEGNWTSGCLWLPGGAWVAFLRQPESCAIEQD